MKKELASCLQQALMVPDLPEITQTILNLAEFMEHCDKEPSNKLPINTQLLGERAMQCGEFFFFFKFYFSRVEVHINSQNSGQVPLVRNFRYTSP